MERINIHLPSDALRKLDEVKKKKGWASRGKTVEFMIAALCDMEQEYKDLQELAKTRDEAPILSLLLRLAKFG